MKGIILYVSKYGSTRQFADWLNEETGFPAVELKKFRGSLKDYDIILFGTSNFAGKTKKAKWIIKKWNKLKDKNFSVFLCTGENKANKENIHQAIERSFPSEIERELKYFPVGGRYDYQTMKGLDKMMIDMALKFTEDEETRKGLLKTTDDVNKENLNPYLEYIRTITNG